MTGPDLGDMADLVILDDEAGWFQVPMIYDRVFYLHTPVVSMQSARLGLSLGLSDMAATALSL